MISPVAVTNFDETRDEGLIYQDPLSIEFILLDVHDISLENCVALYKYLPFWFVTGHYVSDAKPFIINCGKLAIIFPSCLHICCAPVDVKSQEELPDSFPAAGQKLGLPDVDFDLLQFFVDVNTHEAIGSKEDLEHCEVSASMRLAPFLIQSISAARVHSVEASLRIVRHYKKGGRSSP